MPIRVLTVFRVFVLHVPSPDADVGGHCGALDSVAFLGAGGPCRDHLGLQAQILLTGLRRF